MINRHFIRARRLDLGFTQNECAQLARLSGGNYWSDLESGRRTGVRDVTLGRIANALGCGVDALLSKAGAAELEVDLSERNVIRSFSWPPQQLERRSRGVH